MPAGNGKGKRRGGFSLADGLRNGVAWALGQKRERPAAEPSGSFARDLGLREPHPSLLGSVPSLKTLDLPSLASRPMVDAISEAFDLQLELIRKSLGLTTAAILWTDPTGLELRLRAVATARKDVSPGPYPMGSGITGALLQDREEAAMAPVREHLGLLPYYRDCQGVGSLFAIRIPDRNLGGEVRSGQKISGILCVDRADARSWNDSERQVLRLAARRLALDVVTGRQLHDMDRERSALQRVCVGLRELNGALGLNSAFDATVKGIRSLVAADFVGISLVENGCHRAVHADGINAERLMGVEFPIDQGLVGQALKFNCILPEGGNYLGTCPVFSTAHLFAEFRSLFIVPLPTENGEPMGVLTVAAKRPRVFTRSCREILELIATQAAIKIDLARSHEEINQLATTDNLTGLGNQRAFRHGFENMLHRARRRSGPLCLILCDVDHFKSINDNYGHPFGDQVLKLVASVLADTVRIVDLAARYGGEEFAVILEDSDCQSARQVAERLRQAVAGLRLAHRMEEVRVTISLGLADFPKAGDSMSTLIERADQALYQAKRGGRNRCVVWSDLAGQADLVAKGD